MLDVGRDIERIRDYLAGRLSEQESEAFGERLVRDPQLVRELERTLKLSEGLRQLARETRTAAPVPLPRRSRVWLPALAAAAAVGVLAVALWLQSAAERAPLLSASLTHGLAREVAPRLASQFTFVAMRGSAAPVLELPREGRLEFRAAAPQASPASAYRVTLEQVEPGTTPQTLGSAALIGVQADGYLHVYADATRLRAGHYVLNVLSGSDPSPLEVYPFSLRSAGAPPP